MFELQYEFVLLAHISAFIFNITLVVVSDIHGLLWFQGRLSTLSLVRMVWLHRLVWTGLVVAILSGVWLFLTVSEYLLTVPAFYTKMFFVSTLIINSFVISKHIELASSRRYAEISRSEKRILLVSAFVSSASWVGAFISALFLGL